MEQLHKLFFVHTEIVAHENSLLSDNMSSFTKNLLKEIALFTLAWHIVVWGLFLLIWGAVMFALWQIIAIPLIALRITEIVAIAILLIFFIDQWDNVVRDAET